MRVACSAVDLTTSRTLIFLDITSFTSAGLSMTDSDMEPLYRNAPSGAWASLNLGAVVAYRELLYFLTWRDVKVRYKQTLLGAAWAVIQPLFTMLLFTVVFGLLARIPSDGIPYPLFAYAGLLPWTFFSNAVAGSGQSLVGSANLLTKVYFPRLVIPCASVAAVAVDFAIGFVVLVGLMLFFGVGLTWRFVLVLPLALADGVDGARRRHVALGAERQIS